MEHYWQECLRLPQRIQEWDAYKEMRDAIKHYLDVFPILHKLNSKVKIILTLKLLTVVLFADRNKSKVVKLFDLKGLEERKFIRLLHSC